MPVQADGRMKLRACQRTVTDACRAEGNSVPLDVVIAELVDRYHELCRSWPQGEGAELVFELHVVQPVVEEEVQQRFKLQLLRNGQPWKVGVGEYNEEMVAEALKALMGSVVCERIPRRELTLNMFRGETTPPEFGSCDELVEHELDLHGAYEQAVLAEFVYQNEGVNDLLSP